MEEHEKSRVKVLDRRHFTRAGERREADREEGGAPPSPAPEEPAAPPPSGEPSDPRLAGLFSEFIVNLSTSAFLSLGQIPNPLTGRPELDLPAAASIIDILEMLREKTRGNLDLEERGILEKTLTQLKLLYVQVSKKKEG